MARIDNELVFGTGALTDLGQEAEIILGAEVEVGAQASIGEPLWVNVASTGAAWTGENDTDCIVHLVLKGSATTGGALLELGRTSLGPISGLASPLGPLSVFALPARARAYPFLKLYAYNDDDTDDVLTGSLYAWLGGAPQAGMPVNT